MRTIHFRFGIEPVDGAKMLCVGVSTETTKPNPNKKVLAAAVAVIAFVASLYLLDMTDAEAHPQQTIDMSAIIRNH